MSLEMSIPVVGDRATPLASPNGTKIYSYANHSIKVTAEDTMGDRWGADIEFVSCDFDLGNVDLVLGFPWLSIVNPAISRNLETPSPEGGHRVNVR